MTDELREAVAGLFRRHHQGSCWPVCTDNEALVFADAIIPIIACEVAAERERCAKMAERHAFDIWNTTASVDPTQSSSDKAAYKCAKTIAAAIRSLSHE